MSHLTIEDIRAAHSPEEPAASETPSFRRGTQNETPEEPTVRPASEASVNYMRTLIAERYPQATEEYIQSVIDQGQSRVSRAIEKLKVMPRAVRVNRYPGKCVECGEQVEVEEGIAREVNGKWIVQHREEECPRDLYGIPTGRYALQDEDGVIHFYWLKPSGLYAQASDDFHRIAKRGTIGKVINQIKADPQGAAVLYGKELGVCGRCGKTLTSEWRELGIGPVCAQKEGWVV